MTEQIENLQDGNTITASNLQSENFGVSITDNVPSVTVDSAGATIPEDTPTDPREQIINQQQSTIDALMQRTEELTRQINTLIQMGVQINDGNASQPAQELNNLKDADDYVTLAQLGAEFGKR